MNLPFELNEFELRKRRLILKIVGPARDVKGELRISLFKIATGPYHHDFLVRTVDDRDLRISFDLKISQVIQVDSEIL